MSATGRLTGAHHLHFEVLVRGRAVDAMKRGRPAFGKLYITERQGVPLLDWLLMTSSLSKKAERVKLTSAAYRYSNSAINKPKVGISIIESHDFRFD
ncbi:hypothetical protein O9992_26455 [Vibrio lentus]|nr:hypothetical protein [Vibrio lentus]